MADDRAHVPLTSTFDGSSFQSVDCQIDSAARSSGESEFTVEEAVVAGQALVAPTAETSHPAASETQRRGRLLVATLLLVEAVWLTAIGFTLHWLLT
jgi:hypothetical protein